jgi:hypothetical protein
MRTWRAHTRYFLIRWTELRSQSSTRCELRIGLLGHMLGGRLHISPRLTHAALLHVSWSRREHSQQVFEEWPPSTLMYRRDVSVMLQCVQALCWSCPISAEGQEPYAAEEK